MEKFNARMQQKIDTYENWSKATNFIPLKGELIIYTTDENGNEKIGFKVGTGEPGKNIHQLDFISFDEASAVTNITWEDIKNKPFGEEGLEIVWDGNPETALEEPFEVPTMGAILYKVSNETPSVDECVGAYARFQDSEDNEVVTTIDSAQPTDSEDCFVLMGHGHGLFAVALKDGSYNFMNIPFNLTAGVWSVVLSGGYTPLQLGKKTIIKLDEKYLSDTLIKSDMIGVPNGVASLDDNGKVPLEQLPEDYVTETELNNVIESFDTAISNIIGSGVLS